MKLTILDVLANIYRLQYPASGRYSIQYLKRAFQECAQWEIWTVGVISGV